MKDMSTGKLEDIGVLTGAGRQICQMTGTFVGVAQAKIVVTTPRGDEAILANDGTESVLPRRRRNDVIDDDLKLATLGLLGAIIHSHIVLSLEQIECVRGYLCSQGREE